MNVMLLLLLVLAVDLALSLIVVGQLISVCGVYHGPHWVLVGVGDGTNSMKRRCNNPL